MKYLHKESNKYIPVKGADEATHLIISIEEYNEMQKQIADLKRENERIGEKAKRFRMHLIKKADGKVAAVQARVDELQEELDRERRSNENLIRINRERSNAKRSLIPKKKHTGYLVLMSKEIRIPVDKDRFSCMWESAIQTPYTVELSEEEAKSYIGKEQTEAGLLDRLGIQELTGDDIDGRNILYSEKLRANYKSGYWEVVYVHTMPLVSVPTDMRMTR